MATHSSILAWRTPWIKDTGRLTVHEVVESWKWLSVHVHCFFNNNFKRFTQKQLLFSILEAVISPNHCLSSFGS